ncbi:MAG TPA: EAL domain-containing protein [Spirochaetota bacterium]|nr:EAL domain-containing protein [Spirochaetota bacterium]
MKLRYSISWITLASILMYSLFVFLIQTAFISPAFDRIEVESAKRDLERAVNSIKIEQEHISLTARDYGQWDDTVRFIRTGNREYIESNMLPETFINTGLTFIAIYKTDGTPCYSKRIDNKGRIVTWQGMQRDKLLTHLQDHGSEMKNITGIIHTDLGFCIVSSSPVIKADGTGPVAGSFIIGRIINREMADKLQLIAGVPVNFGQDDDKSGGKTDVKSSAGLKPGAISIERKSGYLYAKTALETVDGINPFAVMSTTDISVTTAGRRIIYTFLLAGLIFGTGFSFLSGFVLQKMVSRPLDSLAQNVEVMNLATDSGTVLAPLISRNDEIGSLALSFNSMHERLRTSHEEIRQINETLEEKVNERTAELIKANDNLQFMARVMESTSEGVVITDLDANILQINEAFCRMCGYTPDELIGQNPRIMKSNRHDTAFYKDMWERLTSTGQWSGEIWDRCKAGDVYPQWLTINTIYDENGRPMNYVGISADITRIKKAEEQLHQLAYFDPLTGLPNRTLFHDRLSQAMSRSTRYRHRIGLLYLDLDRFKDINETMGHAAGDDLLVEVAHRIKGRVRESDTVCRLGGDEFTVILDYIGNNDHVRVIAENIIEGLGKPFTLLDREIYANASIGIAIFPEDDNSTEGLLRKADSAMYMAKDAGRGTYRFASVEAEQKSKRRIEIEGNMRRALEQQEFRLFYQPQVALDETPDGCRMELIGAEALIRWTVNGKPLSPESFIHVAEETGIIIPLGRWILTEACRNAATWEKQGQKLKVAVNISARQFEDPLLLSYVEEALAISGLSPSRLQLELTESMFMSNVENAVKIMTTLRALGISLAIDDFGTGYSSMSYLGRYPVDCLKIDKSFIDGLEMSNTGEDVVSAVITLAHAFGLISVAEGVETMYQLEALRKRGCDEIQGYIMSPALPGDEFMQFAGTFREEKSRGLIVNEPAYIKHGE